VNEVLLHGTIDLLLVSEIFGVILECRYNKLSNDGLKQVVSNKFLDMLKNKSLETIEKYILMGVSVHGDLEASCIFY
jgi:hypothetical protein